LKKVILPTAYFPSTTYIARLLKFDDVIIEIHETFPKQTLRNRCEIATSQGSFRLSVPLRSRSNKDKTKDIFISNDGWREQQWRSIVTAYGSSPFFIHYEENVRSWLYHPAENLVDFNLYTLKEILKLLKVNKMISYSEVYEKELAEGITDLRNNNFREEHPTYGQVFQEKTGFISSMSIIDLIFNQGPQAITFLKNFDNGTGKI
jgi:hypothetical protein